MNLTFLSSTVVNAGESGLRKDWRRWDDGLSCLFEGGKSFIAKLITDEEFYLLVGVMIHESFAKNVEEHDPLSALSFRSRLHFLCPSLSHKISRTYYAQLSSCFTYVYVKVLNILCEKFFSPRYSCHLYI